MYDLWGIHPLVGSLRVREDDRMINIIISMVFCLILTIAAYLMGRDVTLFVCTMFILFGMMDVVEAIERRKND